MMKPNWFYTCNVVWFLLYVQHRSKFEKYITRILPTKGEIRVTPASQQAMACAMEKSNVKLQWIPWWDSKYLAAYQRNNYYI